MKNILTDDEIKAIKSMAVYWNEVEGRDDKYPLNAELHMVIEKFGTRILFILSEYVRGVEK